MERYSTDLVVPNRTGVSGDGAGTEFSFRARRGARSNPNLMECLTGAALALLVVVVAIAAWDFFHAWRTSSLGVLLTISAVLGPCLAATGLAAGALLRSRKLAAEHREMTATIARVLQERDLMRAIIDALPDYIYAKDRQGHFVFNNFAHAKDLGAVSAQAMKGRTDFDYFPRELAEQFFADEQRIINTGESVINQEQFKASPGAGTGEKIWSISSKVLWRDREGQILGTVGITRDIHQLKQVEEALRQSEEKLRRSAAQLEQSNRELQDFAYVASHDLQEPLRKIVVFGERLKEKCGDGLAAEPRDYIDRMQKAASRMQTLIDDLLAFSRVTTKANPFAAVNLAEVAREVIEDLEGRIEQVTGRVELGPLPVIDADRLQMRQLLQNLLGNALKFRRVGEPPVVRVTARTWLDENSREVCELTVRDNGIGFDEKYLDRIFNVFQRLHSRGEYEGTGMGLAIVRKIALHHGGHVTAHSQPGQGAAFVVTLPTAHVAEENQPRKNP